jgi:hypothetical protein
MGSREVFDCDAPTMDLTQISTLVGVLGALAVASERLVEIVKKFFPWLDKDNPALSDKWREFWLHVLAVGCGMVTVWLCSAAVKDIKGLAEINPVLAVIAGGFLVGSGSSFWNSVQGYLNKAKEVKGTEAEEKKMRVAVIKGKPLEGE